MVWFYKISWIQTFLQPPTKSRPHGLSDTLKVHFHFLWIPLSLFHILSQKVAHLDSLKFTFTFPQHPTFVFPQPPTKIAHLNSLMLPRFTEERRTPHVSLPPLHLLSKKKDLRKFFDSPLKLAATVVVRESHFANSQCLQLCAKSPWAGILIYLLSRSKNSTKNLLFKAWMMEHTSTHIYKNIVAVASII